VEPYRFCLASQWLQAPGMDFFGFAEAIGISDPMKTPKGEQTGLAEP
jgi:hypothetical protein